MALYNLKTPSRVGRRERPRRHHDPTWNPPDVVEDAASSPVPTSTSAYFSSWGVGFAALGFLALTLLFSVVSWQETAAGAILHGLPLIVVALIVVVTPAVWRARHRRIEAVMRGTLDVDEPAPTGALGVADPGAFVASNRSRLVGCVLAFIGGSAVLALLSSVAAGPLTEALFVAAGLTSVLISLFAPAFWWWRHRRMLVDDDEVDQLDDQHSSRAPAGTDTLTP